MRITKIEIKNFKGFRGEPYVIDLSQKGLNLLLYGENGSGKTSLYEALKYFFESSESDSKNFIGYQNIFDKDDGYVRLNFTPDTNLSEEYYEWSENSLNDTKVQPIVDASRTKGFLNYKDLLKTNYLHHSENSVNVFDLLVNTLLKNISNEQSNLQRSFAQEWQDISEIILPEQATEQVIDIPQQELEDFNIGINNILDILKTNANEILRKFGYENNVVELDFIYQDPKINSNNKYDPPQILLKVKFFENDLLEHHIFLNEAKLSAIALSIFFAGFKLQPSSELQILVIDDALIGLDMSNRLPMFRIMKDYFSDYQIILMTYDRAWYEIVKGHTKEEEWKYGELGLSPIAEYEMPIYMEDKADLDKAKEHLNACDYKACAIYLRTAFETILKDYCDKRGICVRYREDRKKLNTEDFWVRIIAETKQDETYSDHKILKLDQTLVDDIQMYRSITLNPLSHATIANVHGQEVAGAIKAVECLKDELSQHLKATKESSN